MVLPKYIGIVAAIVIIVATATLCFKLMPAGQKVNVAPFIGVGKVLAEETAKAIGDHGRVVLLSTDFEQSQVEGFLREIEGHRQIQVVATERFKVEAPPIEDAMRYMGITNEQFADFVEKYGNADALVTFTELPPINPEQPMRLPAVHPKIIAAIATPSRRPDYEVYLRDKVIVAFVVIRPTSAPDTKSKPRTPREWFDKNYQLVTPQTIDVQP